MVSRNVSPQAQCPRRSPYLYVKGLFSPRDSNLILIRGNSWVCLALRVLGVGAHWVFGHKRICVTAKVFLVPECVPSGLCWLHLGHRRLDAQPAVIFASKGHVSFPVLLSQKATTPAVSEPQIHCLTGPMVRSPTWRAQTQTRSPFGKLRRRLHGLAFVTFGGHLPLLTQSPFLHLQRQQPSHICIFPDYVLWSPTQKEPGPHWLTWRLKQPCCLFPHKAI